MSDISEALLKLMNQAIVGFDPAQPLAEQLDSLALFAVSGKIEAEFGIHLYSVEITPDNMISMDALENLILSKIKDKG